MTRSARRPARTAALAAGALVLVAVPGGAQAASTSGSFGVSASVLASALVTATPMAFGGYNPVTNTADTATSSVTVTATTGTPYQVGIDAGTGTGASVTTRKLTSGDNTLNYSVYRDAGRSSVWGNANGTNTVAGTGNGLPQVLTAYGAIPAGQNVPSGAYTDTLTVTVTY